MMDLHNLRPIARLIRQIKWPPVKDRSVIQAGF